MSVKLGQKTFTEKSERARRAASLNVGFIPVELQRIGWVIMDPFKLLRRVCVSLREQSRVQTRLLRPVVKERKSFLSWRLGSEVIDCIIMDSRDEKSPSFQLKSKHVCTHIHHMSSKTVPDEMVLLVGVFFICLSVLFHLSICILMLNTLVL